MPAGIKPARPENRFGVDYAQAAGSLGPPPVPILDIHSHVNGRLAGPIWLEAARRFGVERVWTMVRLEDCELVRSTLGELVEFIAFPNFRHPDRRHAFTEGFLHDIQAFRNRFGARMIKLWNAPRMYEFFPDGTGTDLIAFDSPWRLRHAELAQHLGMGIMVHVADPDTWFATKYKDASKFPPKREHYRGLRVALDRFEGPWLAAHMGGSPEDLDFLDELLHSHPNLHLDTSATKWVVRELSRHPRARVVEFFQRWQGRILFGSDIVAIDEHVDPSLAPKPAPPAPATGSVSATGSPAVTKHPMAELAGSPQEAFDLYASRYCALRLMFETDYAADAPLHAPTSPIADPDLRLVNPEVTDPLVAPRLRGLGLSEDLLRTLYRGAAETFLAKIKAR